MEGEEFDCIYKYITAVLDCNENLGVTSFPFLETMRNRLYRIIAVQTSKLYYLYLSFRSCLFSWDLVTLNWDLKI